MPRRLVESVRLHAQAAGASATEVIWGDEVQLRHLANDEDFRGFEQLVAGNARRLARGGRSGRRFALSRDGLSRADGRSAGPDRRRIPKRSPASISAP